MTEENLFTSVSVATSSTPFVTSKKNYKKRASPSRRRTWRHRRTSSAAAECAPTTDMRSPQKADASGLHTTRHRCALRASGSNE